jgi:hypothetical protein
MISALMIERNCPVFRMQAASFQRAGDSGYRRPLFAKLFLLQEYVICKMKNQREIRREKKTEVISQESEVRRREAGGGRQEAE